MRVGEEVFKTVSIQLRIIDVSRDHAGEFIKLDVQLADGRLLIRWDLDHFTYKNLKEIVSAKPFDSLASDYQYELADYICSYQEKPHSQPTFTGVVKCSQGNRKIRLEFECSERFAGNMEWFRQKVREIEDIKHLAWDTSKK